MPVKKVWFHESFFYGKNNSDYFQDHGFMNTKNLDLLDEFVIDVLLGEELHGRNKKSWLNPDGSIILGSSGYQNSNVWHYHCGSHDKTKKTTTKNIRNENCKKQTSSEIIHYTWQGKKMEELIILGFSPTHSKNNFPKATDKKNPLRTRISPLKYNEIKLIDPNKND